MTVSWQILVPVRGGLAPKSRLAEAVPHTSDRIELALAFSADVVAAALSTPGVRGVTVVTGDARSGERLAAIGAAILDEQGATGLDPAVGLGAEHLMRRHPGDGIAVLMGDLPRITPGALAEGLLAAASVERGVLGDRDGTGTALLTAMPGHAPRPAYGEGSFARHIEAGHVPLAVPAHHSPLWHDIDTPADLMRALEGVADDVHGIGPRTREALARIALDTP